MFEGVTKLLAVVQAAIALPVLLAAADSKPNAAETQVAQADQHQHANASQAKAAPKQAIAVLHPTKGNDVQGHVTFTQSQGTIHLKGKVTGLTPGKHGFHIHEFGDLTAADGTSAGGHFDPTGAPHAGPDAEHRHAGDFGNIEANQDGVATIDIKSKMISLQGKNGILGRSVVVHAGADDLESQPSGDSGPRVAVGVIGVAQSKIGDKKPAANQGNQRGASGASSARPDTNIDLKARVRSKQGPGQEIDPELQKTPQ